MRLTSKGTRTDAALRGSGGLVPMPALDAIGLPFVLQLQSTTDQCWETTFSAAGVRRRTMERIQVVSD